MNLILKYITLCFIGTINGVFANSSHDVIKVDSLNDASYDLGSLTPLKAFELAEESKKLADKIGYTKGEIMALCRMGNAMYLRSKLDSALFFYNQAEILFKEEQEQDSVLLAKIYIYQAPIYTIQGRLDWSIAKYHQVYFVAMKNHDWLLAGSALLNISGVLKSQNKYSEALSLIHKAIDILPKGSYNEVGAAFNGLANIYQDQGRPKEAINALKAAENCFYQSENLFNLLKSQINLGNLYSDLGYLDSAMHNYVLVNRVAKEQEFLETESIACQNIGSVFFEIGQLDSALYYFNNSFRIKKQIGDLEGQLESTKSIGQIALIKNELTSAISAFGIAREIALIFDDLESLEEITANLSNCYQILGDWPIAMDYLERSKAYQDTLTNQLNDAFVYEVNYEQEKRRVSELQLILREKDIQLQKQHNSIWIIVIVSCALCLILYVMLRLNKQKRIAAEGEKENLRKQKEISDLINKQEQAELSAMFSGQETERNRIAVELHDNLGGMLSTVKLYFKSIDDQINQLKEENIKQFYKANDLLDHACDRTRKIAHELSSKSLGRIGLFRTIINLQDQINDSGQIKFNLNTHGTDDKLERLNQISIYRIIQELVNNILKHALATEISVQLNVFHDIFNLIVEDDGIGFDVNQMIFNAGIGLRETEARVKNMGGKLTIDSGIGGGTSVTIDIPLNKQE